SMTVSLSNPSIAYCTQTSGNSGCAPGSLAVVTGAAATPQITTAPFPLALISSQHTGVAVNVNLANALTVNSQTQVVSAVNLGAVKVLTTAALPPEIGRASCRERV